MKAEKRTSLARRQDIRIAPKPAFRAHSRLVRYHGRRQNTEELQAEDEELNRHGRQEDAKDDLRDDQRRGIDPLGDLVDVAKDRKSSAPTNSTRPSTSADAAMDSAPRTR